VTLSLFAFAGVIEFVASNPFDLSLFERESAEEPGDTVAQTLDWRALAELNYRTGIASPQLQRANGHLVRIPGFIVPLDDFEDEAREFLLVPYFGACVHTPTPPPNQLVLVRMKRSTPIADTWARAVWIEGRLSIGNVGSYYGIAGYTLRGLRVQPYK
jgi:hypothetical protein